MRATADSLGNYTMDSGEGTLAAVTRGFRTSKDAHRTDWPRPRPTNGHARLRFLEAAGQYFLPSRERDKL
jgi:hypothetical protein